MVLINGGMVGIEQEKKAAPAILEAFYPGFWGSAAIADTLFGQNENLGGSFVCVVLHIKCVHFLEWLVVGPKGWVVPRLD